MTHPFRVGLTIYPADPYWVQVREAVYEKAQELSLELFSINLVDYPQMVTDLEQMALLEELQALELDALIVWSLPEDLAHSIPQFGIPLILLSETEARHPLLVSPVGLYDIAQTAGQFLAQELAGQGHVLALGGLMQKGWQDDGSSRVDGIRVAFQNYPALTFTHIPSLWPYEQAYRQVYQVMQTIDRPIDAIFGLSDALALVGREAGQALGLIDPHTLIVGIGGTPAALAAISAGHMRASAEIRTDELGQQAVDLAYLAAQRRPLPAHFEYQSRLVTAQNVGEVAAQKLIAIADLPNRLVGVRRRQQQERLTQLETSSAISRRVGSILDHHQLSHEIANLIRANYGYDQVQILHWSEEAQSLTLDQSEQQLAGPLYPSLDPTGVLKQAFTQNKAIFIPDTQRSPRFPPDPNWPDTRTRVILPIRLGHQVLGLLDLHSRRSALRTRQELDGLQALAEQLGIAIQNARLYGEAVAARAAAEKADQLKTRLLANVSHELRTPLNVILGYTETALNPAQSPSLPALLKDMHAIERSADHLLRIINDLLDLSRAEIDELDLQVEIIPIHQFLVDVFESMAGSVDSHREVTWRLNLPERLPLIQADPLRLRQILLNLLSNARKFTDRGQISLGAEVLPPYLHVWVQDTGLGIPAEVQEGIFEPFITAEQPDRRRQGIGLGLSITRRLVALHRGSMALESQPGQGSTFHVYLPLPSLADPVASLSPASTQPVLLLLSAQDQPLAEIVHLSRQLGVPIRCVKTGEDLETVLRATQPVILAWDTAGATPAEWHLMRQLQSHPRLSQAPFILYSQPPANLGPSNLITKPVSPKTLLDMINTLRLPALNGPILIVDDDPPTCEFYQNLVAQALSGYAIRTAHNGATALDIMAKEAPSLVILDLNMPELDGFDVLDWMRANPSTRPVPVLILSGRMLSFEDAQRLAGHALVTFQSKGLLSVEETAAALQRQLFSLEALPPHTSAVVKRAVAYFHHNYHRPLSRPEIAEAVGVSENYLSRIFSQELGLLPWQYLNRYRVMQAKRLLDQTNDSITAIALQVGFNDPAYFSKVFLREANCSPTEYRKRAIASIG